MQTGTLTLLMFRQGGKSWSNVHSVTDYKWFFASSASLADVLSIPAPPAATSTLHDASSEWILELPSWSPQEAAGLPRKAGSCFGGLYRSFSCVTASMKASAVL